MTKVFENAINSVMPDDDPRKAKVPQGYYINMEDVSWLVGKALREDPFYAIHYAFLYGFVMGNRATITRKMKKL